MENVGPWTQRWVVVCGGTSGLGLELVIAAAQQRANLIIVGRDPTRLENAKAMALEQGANSATTYSIDLAMKKSDSSANSQSRDETQLRLWLEMNQVDLLLNAIGRSDRGPLEQLSDTDLHSMLNDNVLCTWNMTRMTLASLKRARGTIVNIGSLAGLVPAPGMGGYSVAKTALTAMSRQLRVELADVGVHVMLVCPGPIARHDSGSRYDQLAVQRGLADGASTAPGGGVKLKALDPKILCRKILLAAHRRKYELVTPVKASLLAGISNLWPRLSDWILKKYMRKQS
ncbi:MAG: SDR family NAD(P)-dependent oxidoreductase [Planctomycetota bacterium]|nr:SDR family NAD(P)-dependent oxidoreductase [Planctomycetota bacterium]